MSSTENGRIVEEIPEYDDYFNTQTEPVNQMTAEEVVNFAYVLDKNKQVTKDLPEMEMEVIWAMKRELDQEKVKEKLKVLYEHHLDLFIKYDKLFLSELKKSEANMLEYTKMKQAYVTVDNYFNGLKTHNMLSGLKIKSPRKLTAMSPSPKSPSIFSDNSSDTHGSNTTNKRDSRSSLRDSRSSLLSAFRRTQKLPDESIFSQIEPKKFAEKCHKMFVYCYFAQESRVLQYQARHPGTETGYAKLMKGIFNNLLFKLLNEVDIYCRADRTKRLMKILSEVGGTLFGLGNLALGKLVMFCVDTLKDCQKELAEEIKEKIGDKRQYEKYPYLVDPAFIQMNFIHALENPHTMAVGNKIHKKLLQTKLQIMEDNTLAMQAEFEDFLVFNYLQPEDFIEDPLYQTNGRTTKSKCIEDKCEQRGGFDKSSAKFPRRYSKEYCTKTPCHKMGFTQRASCRYYKNCYKQK